MVNTIGTYRSTVVLVRVRRQESRAWARPRDALVERSLVRYLIRHWDELRRSQDAREMAYIAAEEHKRISGSPDERRDVSDGVAGNIQDVEAAISKIIMRLELTDLQIIREWHFDYLPPFKIGFVKGRVWFCWISWQEGLSEFWTHDHLDGLGQFGRGAAMVEVPMAQDQRFHVINIDAAFSKDAGDTFGNPKSRHTGMEHS